MTVTFLSGESELVTSLWSHTKRTWPYHQLVSASLEPEKLRLVLQKGNIRTNAVILPQAMAKDAHLSIDGLHSRIELT